MIKKNIEFGNLKDVTVLEFGKGDIQVQPALGEDYAAVLYKTDEPHLIGTEHETKGKDSDWFKTEIAMTFTNVDSIDVVIKKLTEARSYLTKKELVNNLPISDVSGWLTLQECASLYGEKVNCKWLSPDGNDWIDKKMDVNHSFLKEMEKGSIKEAYR